jgi:AcrR family transcriptional regulator
MAGRERNPERSRERILNAALEEFAANGYAGARVDAIAKRAGLNKQLISHHFGGKEALYQAVMTERKMRGGGEMTGEPDRMPDALATFFDRASADPEWIRVMLWEALETGEGTGGPAVEARRARYETRIAWVKDEQAEGRLPADLEPDMLYLMLLGLALYPVLLPQVAELATGSRTDTDEFAQRYREQLRLIAAHLGR